MKTTITKEKDMLKKDLTTVETSYVYYLNKEVETVKQLCSRNLNEFKQGVLKIIEPANDTPAKRNFIMTLNRQRDISNATIFVYNALLKGAGMGVI